MSEGRYEAGPDSEIQPGTTLGLVYREGAGPARFGRAARLRTGTIVYGDVETGDFFQTGHHVLIRERTRIGDHVVVGTGTVIDGQVTIGDFVKIESNCYIPTHVEIGSRVFIGPGTTLTNDRYPLKLRDRYRPEGPVLEEMQRHLHTLKGGARMAGLADMGDLSHDLEALVIAVNSGRLELSPANSALLQSVVDNLHGMRDQVAAGRAAARPNALLQQLAAALAGEEAIPVEPPAETLAEAGPAESESTEASPPEVAADLPPEEQAEESDADARAENVGGEVLARVF